MSAFNFSNLSIVNAGSRGQRFSIADVACYQKVLAIELFVEVGKGAGMDSCFREQFCECQLCLNQSQSQNILVLRSL